MLDSGNEAKIWRVNKEYAELLFPCMTLNIYHWYLLSVRLSSKETHCS